MNLTVQELRSAVESLLDAVGSKYGSDLHLPVDFYWNVSQPFDIYNEQPDVDMGHCLHGRNLPAVLGTAAQWLDRAFAISGRSGNAGGGMLCSETIHWSETHGAKNPAMAA